MLNLDTHIVLKWIEGSLTQHEYDLVLKSELCISDIVLWEIAKLHELGRIRVSVTSSELRGFLTRVRVLPIDSAIAHASTQLDFRSDPADEIIAATSVVHGCSLLTRDQRIRASKFVPLA